MKILVIFTGGTIGSFYDDAGYISSDSAKPYKLLKLYNEKFPNDIIFDTACPYTILSENLDGTHLSMLAAAVRPALGQNYDGIIITHGSDTLQYTAAYLSYILGNDTLPVVLVAANYVLEDSRSNGLTNFAGAVTFIREHGGRGVFASYANTGEECLIHRGLLLMPHTMADDYLRSLDNSYFGSITHGHFHPNPSYQEVMNSVICDNGDNLDADSHVMWINVHPGMSLPKPPDDTRAVLISAYHSGTLSTGSSAFTDWLSHLRARGIPVFLSGATPGPDYATCESYDALGIKVLPHMSPVAAYMKLWLEST